MHIDTCEQIATALSPLDEYLAKVAVHADALELGVGPEGHLDGFGLAIGVGRKVENLAAGGAGGEVVLAVVGDACHIKALDVAGIGGAIAVDGIVDGALVAFLKHGYVHHLHLLFLFGLHAFGFAYEHFVLHTCHLVGAIAVEDDDIVDGRAVLDKLVLLRLVPIKPFSRSM